MTIMKLLTVASALLTSPVSSYPTDTIDYCGVQPYDKKQYTCYGNEVLCPFQNGYPQSRCGFSQQCYLPFRYVCDNGTLTEYPDAQGPFEIVAINLYNISEHKVSACGNRFWVGRGDEACTYCPALPQSLGSCPPGKDTVLLPGSGMATLVPGGQRYWIEPSTGEFQYSVPHSALTAPGALFNFLALDNGTFTNAWADGWMACPDPGPTPGDDPVALKLFAKLPGLTFDVKCKKVNLVTRMWKPADGSNSTQAAWEYT